MVLLKIIMKFSATSKNLPSNTLRTEFRGCRQKTVSLFLFIGLAYLYFTIEC